MCCAGVNVFLKDDATAGIVLSKFFVGILSSASDFSLQDPEGGDDYHLLFLQDGVDNAVVTDSYAVIMAFDPLHAMGARVLRQAFYSLYDFGFGLWRQVSDLPLDLPAGKIDPIYPLSHPWPSLGP